MEQYNYEAAMMDDVKEYINNEYSSKLDDLAKKCGGKTSLYFGIKTSITGSKY